LPTPEGAPPARILRVISRLNVGGPARQVFWVSEGLRRFGYETTVVAGRVPDNEDSLEPVFDAAGIPVRRFPEMEREISVLSDVAAAWRMRRLVREVAPDLIHVHLSKAAFLVRMARLFSPFARHPPVVYTHHGNRFRGYFRGAKAKAVLWTEKALAPFTSRFLVLSPQQRDEIARDLRIGRPARYRVVPLGIDLAFTRRLAGNRGALRRELGIAPARPLVGIVGRVAPIKAHEMFVDAAAAVREGVPPGEGPAFVVIGSGAAREMSALEERAGARGIATDFFFAGTRPDPGAFLADLDLVALTSRNEGTPLSLIEAMAAGLPIVATDVGGVRDLLTREWEGDPGKPWRVSSEPRGLLVASGDVAGFAAALRSLLADPEARRRMGEAGRRFAESRFSIDRLLSDLDAVYRELLPARR
jgi:glycosyltransferase involved in cell wall biosynthesis